MSTLTVPAPTATPTAVPARSGVRALLRDTGIVMVRELRPWCVTRSR